MSKISFKQQLEKVGACKEAIDWVGDRDLATAWTECKRGDWMIWLASRAAQVEQATWVKIACACARLSLKYVPEGENRPRLAIEAAERWTESPTEENKTAADAAAYAAAYAAADAAADAAAYAARAAAYAARAAADAAARAAADAAYAAADAAARAAADAAQADIVRSFITVDMIKFRSDSHE